MDHFCNACALFSVGCTTLLLVAISSILTISGLFDVQVFAYFGAARSRCSLADIKNSKVCGDAARDDALSKADDDMIAVCALFR